MNFGQAIEAVKQGLLISRSGWNGKGMFVFQRPSDVISFDMIEKIKSLPDSVKKYYSGRADLDQGITFTGYLCMKAADHTIVNGWLASQTDMLAEDWEIVS